ncbi:MAG: ATP synthase F1 subunit gamma [Ruminococcaceae bacterium]|nr:ATP synthase F1 subunit gamma [Oscillospiraceae bacterium]
MAGNTKALRGRIKSVTSTLQLTKAMELVASSKIRRASEAMLKAREYTEVLERSISLLTSDPDSLESPYMRPVTSDSPRTRIIIIAGDRGLAGGYNANVFRLASFFPDAEFIPVGKRACERYGEDINSSERYYFDEAYELSEKLCSDFRAGGFDRLGILYTEYVSVMTQEARIKWILPLTKAENGSNLDIIFEPDQKAVLNNAVREYVAGMMIATLRESFACEVAARRMAMESAGKNAKEMIDRLQLEYNRARQGAITQEITEIVAGSGS